jgi:hypothetical protein
MIWRRGFVYAHSPLPKNLDGRKFDLVFLFAHSPFPSWTSVSSALRSSWFTGVLDPPIDPARFSERFDPDQYRGASQDRSLRTTRSSSPCGLLRATKRKVSAHVNLLHMQLALQKCPAIMKSEPPVAIGLATLATLGLLFLQ